MNPLSSWKTVSHSFCVRVIYFSKEKPYKGILVISYNQEASEIMQMQTILGHNHRIRETHNLMAMIYNFMWLYSSNIDNLIRMQHRGLSNYRIFIGYKVPVLSDSSYHQFMIRTWLSLIIELYSFIIRWLNYDLQSSCSGYDF